MSFTTEYVASRDRVTASDRAYAELLGDIQSGALPAGFVLGEVEQAERLGVSRTPLREALRRLAAEGLVVQQSPRVTVVARLDADDIRALFETRRALEEMSARLAAQRGDTAVFAALADEFGTAELSTAEGREEYYMLIARFDDALDAAVSNDYIASALRTVRAHLVRVRRMAQDRPGRLAESAAEHRAIARALAMRDGDLAAHATHVHLHNALASILDSFPFRSDLIDTEGHPA